MTTTLLSILAAVVLAVLVVAFWGLTVLGLPGNWINAILVAGYGWLIPDNWRVDVGWPWIVACFALAAVGEAIEFVAGAVGTSRAGGSRRSAAGAIVGSLVGGIGGAFVALPIPIAGPLVGAILFGGVGAAVGAAVAEKSAGADADHSLRVGEGAFWGRLVGTGAKTLIGAVLVAAVVVALLF